VAIYSAAKAFMDAMTTSLYRELRGGPVSVSVVRPGPVASEFFQASASRPGSGMIPGKEFAIRPEAVAAAVWSLVRRPRRFVYVPWFLWVTPWFELLLGWLVDLLGPLLLKGKKNG
jgi:short-subunit dehydrogenase